MKYQWYFVDAGCFSALSAGLGALWWLIMVTGDYCELDIESGSRKNLSPSCLRLLGGLNH